MKFGLFNIPYSRGYSAGRRTPAQVIDWDLTITKWADQNGWDEVYFAEHYTLGGEPSPAPDVMIAAASQVTTRIKLGAAAHLLAYHNPISLAHRIMWLDHMTGGRYIAGFAPGAFPSDAQLFNTGKKNPEMMTEAIGIIEDIWTKKGPFRIEGQFWTVDMPAYDDDIHGPHLTPLQKRIPVIMTGMQAKSPTLAVAGENGYFPMSQQVHSSVLREHWATYAAAAESTGHRPDRADWRICRDVLVADTDEQARDAYLNGSMGDLWGTYNIPTFIKLGLGELVTGGTIPQEELSAEWMVDDFHLVGSPQTVAAKIEALYEEVGGFGSLISFGHEYVDDPDVYRKSFELVGAEVAPLVSHLKP
ncbi:LLM class flavin-dependent oxidoreductase [Mycolicibacterium sp. S2-37]|uniref:LLM class flavin-dependent oxidoreductase n=1 Tax=Mycolicibacterium sp. S2-37 TaxID=2810297 RepID=UPI001A945437|nr:LLM class flavin-dependent oxidoreductase [Mycolicibacterium sp. S2-37]MBO0678371.1 LLM class flavin-dependent oxidoreductase [Mycolicibacterium sp. S2-37]